METETYTAFGESYTITRTAAGYYVTHDGGEPGTRAAFGTRGYATHYARTHAQRIGQAK